MRTIGFLGVALAVAAVPVLAQQRVDEKRPASANGTVEISNVSGSVRVVGWERAEVAVTGTLGRGTERLELSGSGDRTVVKVVLPHFATHVDGSDIEVTVPAGSSVEIETVSADQAVDKVQGSVRVRSVSGGINVAGMPREFDAKTVSGDLEITAANAPGRAATVSGTVTLRGVGGEVEARSVSGDVTVKGGETSRVELQTTSGNVHFDASLAKDGRLDVKSVSGTVNLDLPASTAADFDISTFSGDITNELGPAARRTSEYAPGQELSFSTGSGGARVVAKSFSGSIHLRKQ
jgi:DUF4097 and DUF4098 domain-containing protein YvlB